VLGHSTGYKEIPLWCQLQQLYYRETGRIKLTAGSSGERSPSRRGGINRVRSSGLLPPWRRGDCLLSPALVGVVSPSSPSGRSSSSFLVPQRETMVAVADTTSIVSQVGIKNTMCYRVREFGKTWA
jgi:hypothetical protein